MSLLAVVLISAVCLLAAYFTYGRTLVRLLRLDPNAKTPAVELRDDVDYSPLEPNALLSQHFSAIAAAGPIVGPILAGAMFGWVPALIWILVGSILIGGVHDFTALVASIRHKARSIAEVVRDHMTQRSYLLFLLFVWLALVYIIVAFTDVTAESFIGCLTLEDGTTNVTGAGIATSSLLYLALPIIMGLMLRYTKLSLGWATVIFMPLVGVAIWIGQSIPFDVEGFLRVRDRSLSPHEIELAAQLTPREAEYLVKAAPTEAGHLKELSINDFDRMQEFSTEEFAAVKDVTPETLIKLQGLSEVDFTALKQIPPENLATPAALAKNELAQRHKLTAAEISQLQGLSPDEFTSLKQFPPDTFKKLQKLSIEEFAHLDGLSPDEFMRLKELSTQEFEQLSACAKSARNTAHKIWDVALLLYCCVASVIPLWLLLQPRGHLGGYFLYAALAGGALGLVFGGKPIQYPSFIGWTTANGDSLFPILFITIACGACSGFHSIIASGTTSKQLRRETDARLIGYGAMLLEGMVAVVSLCCVMMLAQNAPELTKAGGQPAPNLIYARGIGAFLEVLHIPPALGISFALMAFTTFVYDTLDVCTRLGRYIIQELTGWRDAKGRWLGTIVTAGVPIFFVMQTTLDPVKGTPIPVWKTFWALFGASNQLLAALTLLGVTVWLWRTRRARWVWFVTGIPMVWMYVMSSWALIRFVIAPLKPWMNGSKGISELVRDGTLANPVPWVAAVLVGLALLMLIEAVRVIAGGGSGRIPPQQTVPATA